ncbi:MAG: alpha/beta fold hydrolase [Haloarculaceae archaeon]
MIDYTHETWTDAQELTTVTVDGHDVEQAYWDSSTVADHDVTSEEPPVVFVHGIPTWSFLWRDVAPAVAAETGRRAIAVDMVGYGNSDMRDSFDRSVRAQEQALADLLGQLGIETAAIVAHDIGGGVAVRYASHRPDAVSSLVMSNAVCYDSWPVEFVSNLGLPQTARQDHEEFMTMLRGAFRQGLYDDEGHEGFLEGIAAPWDSEVGQVSLSRNGVATNTNHTTEIDYGAIDADLLCLWGADDVMQPLAYGERLAEEVGGEVVELEAYHWVVEDRPERYVEEVVAFLSE